MRLWAIALTFDQGLCVSLGEVIQQGVVTVCLRRTLTLGQGCFLFGVQVSLHRVY